MEVPIWTVLRSDLVAGLKAGRAGSACWHTLAAPVRASRGVNAPFRTPRHSGESATLQPADLEVMPAVDPAAPGRGGPAATLHKDELPGPSANAPAPDSAAKTALLALGAAAVAGVAAGAAAAVPAVALTAAAAGPAAADPPAASAPSAVTARDRANDGSGNADGGVQAPSPADGVGESKEGEAGSAAAPDAAAADAAGALAAMGATAPATAAETEALHNEVRQHAEMGVYFGFHFLDVDGWRRLDTTCINRGFGGTGPREFQDCDPGSSGTPFVIKVAFGSDGSITATNLPRSEELDGIPDCERFRCLPPEEQDNNWPTATRPKGAAVHKAPKGKKSFTFHMWVQTIYGSTVPASRKHDTPVLFWTEGLNLGVNGSPKPQDKKFTHLLNDKEWSFSMSLATPTDADTGQDKPTLYVLYPGCWFGTASAKPPLKRQKPSMFPEPTYAIVTTDLDDDSKICKVEASVRPTRARTHAPTRAHTRSVPSTQPA